MTQFSSCNISSSDLKKVLIASSGEHTTGFSCIFFSNRSYCHKGTFVIFSQEKNFVLYFFKNNRYTGNLAYSLTLFSLSSMIQAIILPSSNKQIVAVCPSWMPSVSMIRLCSLSYLSCTFSLILLCSFFR